VSADVTTTNQLLELAEEVGDSIVVLKTHADIVFDFTDRTIRCLRDIAARKNFLVFEDRKFGDIGSTVQRQYVAGPLSIVRWATIVNAHVFPGPAIITALKDAAEHALAASNARVSTEISAAEDGQLLDSRFINFPPSDSEDSSGSNTASPSISTTITSGSSDENAIDDDEQEPRLSLAQHSSRKPSIISVCSSITTRYENVAPPPSPGPKIPIRYPGESTSAAIERLGHPPISRGLLLLAQMSSEHNLLTPEYTKKSVEMAREHRDFVMGFISQQSLNSERDDNFISMTPGVSLAGKGDGLGQQYNSPQRLIRDEGTDIIIVGRGILNADDKTDEAERYRIEGWKAYEERVGLRKMGR
jgi:uridine monophosphate synthetase